MQTQSNKIDFKGQHIYVGLDVHLNSWKVTILTEELTHKKFVQPPSPEILYQYLVRNFPGAHYHTAYEAGFCGYWIHYRLTKLGIDSIVVNAADIPTTGKEIVQKDDARDSNKIARCLRSGDLHAIHVPSLNTLEDRNLVRLRYKLVKDQTRCKNRIKSFLYFWGIEFPQEFSSSNTHWSRRFFNWLDNLELKESSREIELKALCRQAQFLRTEILQLTKEIRDLSKTVQYQQDQRFLRSIFGINYITAMMILTELEAMSRFHNFDQLCSYVGFVPSTNSSGENKKVGDITPRGHSLLRSALVESAWTAARLDPVLSQCYHEYCKRMKPNDAIIRIARKLLSRIRFVLNNKQPYVCMTAN